jgi:hypothetical protein
VLKHDFQTKSAVMRSSILKYSLQALLFAVVCLAGYMAGYRSGTSRGYQEGNSIWFGDGCVARDYVLADLAGVQGLYSVADIESVLRTGLQPTSWDTVGGSASISVSLQSDGNPMLSIRQTPGAHEEIDRIFAQLRAGADQ